jgi:dimethylhistidine N-methyltransferase
LQPAADGVTMTGSRTALRPGWAFASWKRDIASEDRMRQSRLSSRYFLAESDPHDERATFGEEIAQGLRAARKWIPCRFMYDQAGSGLFEEICDLPEYYVTRAERQILEDHSDEIAGSFAEPVSLAELGSGSSLKTRLLIEAFLRRQGTLRYVPVDISRSMLDESARELLDDYGGLEIHAIASEYVDGLRRVGGETERPKLIAWLGSNVGNFDRAAASRFLRRIRDAMGERDRLLLGVDLRKDRAVLEAAYDDAAGVTARFNLNLLERINRDLDGGFDVGARCRSGLSTSSWISRPARRSTPRTPTSTRSTRSRPSPRRQTSRSSAAGSTCTATSASTCCAGSRPRRHMPTTTKARNRCRFRASLGRGFFCLQGMWRSRRRGVRKSQKNLRPTGMSRARSTGALTRSRAPPRSPPCRPRSCPRE